MLPIRSVPPQAGRTSRQFRRSLFNQKDAIKKLKNSSNDEPFHHEYSVRPDTYAFKVSAANERTRLVDTANIKAEAPTTHPLQKTSGEEGFNLIKFIYRYSTNYPFGDKSPQQVYNEYPSTTSSKLARSKYRPKKVKMLASDFIEDSLYNPHYGYFSKEVEIFHPEKPFDYNNINDIDDFMDSWQQAYRKYDDLLLKSLFKKQSALPVAAPNKLDTAVATTTSKLAQRAHSLQMEEALNDPKPKSRRSLQLWHTPTELFQPYYGEALARYLLVNYKLNGAYPYQDLIIYEMGGGNGTLMCNILDYIKKHQPDVYNRTQYKIIEISSQLAEKQLESAMKSKLIQHGLDTSKLEIVNKSIFEWDRVVEEPCFFIALEVFDNFAHDLIRYDNVTGEPHEGQVLVDQHGDFYEFFTPQLSYYSNAFLQLRENGEFPVLGSASTLHGRVNTLKSTIPFLTDKDLIHPLHHSSAKLRWQNSLLPFKDNLTPGEFIPTRLLQFFQILKHKFPNHSLVCSDFHSLPKNIGGYYNAPVVQTVLQDKMVDVSTYMCYQGYFDIMFPTDFDVASDLYKQVTGKIAKVDSHRDFLELWADVESTRTKKGENPMLDFYENVSFMVS
ncbi:DUF185-domain-containing protein [Suhomyces tanzawaensis NRRL Y-17324]|uniref:type II protein arginine methyltransferase n=1 Tax=Suhomyces tanzawaensis NRRL Y-17324 TaxID=984487 RepID=A0A1E4SCG2_9ASCO|nr:DUF185-domain-containing protein [Suhomyces tanzawaensis NRRL Y-17324]ODV77185.1 DUF185-domain-containing protein [Suhomyces tanzawaensis NRRL Y-17324]